MKGIGVSSLVRKLDIEKAYDHVFIVLGRNGMIASLLCAFQYW